MAEVIIVTSGKGGAGKSTVCAFLGEALALQDKHVLLLETGQRTLDVMFGVTDRLLFDLADIVNGRCVPADAMVHAGYSEYLLLIASPLGEHVTLDAQACRLLLQELDAQFDYILVEVPGWDKALLRGFGAVAERAVIVSAPDQASARACRIVSDLLADAGVWEVRLCVNQLMPDFLKRRPIPDLDWLIDTVCAQLICVLPHENVLISVNSVSDVVTSSRNVSIIFDNFAQRIAGKYIDLWIG